MPFGVAFGITCSDAGLAAWQASAFSMLVFTGSAQFAAVGVIGDGGSAVSAVAAGTLLNLRSLAFGVVMASALQGPWWKRALWSQVMIDETTALGSAQDDLRWRRYAYLFCGAAVFTSWNLSTLVGAAALSSSGDLVTDWGIDAAIPAAFLALLWPRLTDPAQRRSAAVGAIIALALVPIAPPGVPILAAAIGVLAGWRTTSPPADGAPKPARPDGAPVDDSVPVDGGVPESARPAGGQVGDGLPESARPDGAPVDERPTVS